MITEPQQVRKLGFQLSGAKKRQCTDVLTEPGMIVGVHGAGEESAAVVLGSVAALAYRGGAGEPIQLLSRTAQPVGRIRVLAVSRPTEGVPKLISVYF